MAIVMHVCSLCGHEEADTLLTRVRWQRLESADGEIREACAQCQQEHADWAARLASVDGSKAK